MKWNIFILAERREKKEISYWSVFSPRWFLVCIKRNNIKINAHNILNFHPEHVQSLFKSNKKYSLLHCKLFPVVHRILSLFYFLGKHHPNSSLSRPIQGISALLTQRHCFCKQHQQNKLLNCFVQLKILNAVYHSSVKSLTTKLHQFKYFLEPTFIYCVYFKTMGGWGGRGKRSWKLNQLKILPHFFLQVKKLNHFKDHLTSFVPQAASEISSLFSTRPNSGTAVFTSMFFGNKWGITVNQIFFHRLLKLCWVRAEIRSPVLNWIIPVGSLLPVHPSSPPVEVSIPLLQ